LFLGLFFFLFLLGLTLIGHSDLLVDVVGSGVLAIKLPKLNEEVGLKQIQEQLMAVGEFGGWAIHRVPSQVLLGVPDGARVVRVTPPVLGDQAEQLPSEMEATRHRDKVLEAVCSGVLVCQRLLRPHDPVHSELITVGQNELVFQLQLLTDLPQDGRGACQAGLVLGEQLAHAQLGAMGGRGELGDSDLAEGIDMLDENGLDNHPQAGLLALKALLVGQNLGTNKNKVSISTFLSSFLSCRCHSHHRLSPARGA